MAIATFASNLPEIAELIGNQPKYSGSYKVRGTHHEEGGGGAVKTFQNFPAHKTHFFVHFFPQIDSLFSLHFHFNAALQR